MESHKDYNALSHRRDFWSFIGYLSFGIFGIFLGAVLVYGLFTAFLAPQVEDSTIDTAQEDLEIVTVLPVSPDSSLVDIVDRVLPAVVGVQNHVYISNSDEQSLQEIESGSGVIISADGYIITNQHVIENADKITVLIPNKGRYIAELIGTDALTDLALLRIEETGLRDIAFGDSEKLRIGETVVAIGNPLGYFQQTVTAGIISAVGRQVSVPGSEYVYTYIQTDALVNPGNSGGPLINLQGEIIGIITAKISLAGVEGIGLSIPSNIVKRVMGDLREHGRVIRPHLGVVIDDWLDYSDQEPEKGVLILEVAPDSAADKAGLVSGDIIVAIDGRDVLYLAQLFDRLFLYYPDDTITLTYFREGQKV
ncbi:MAG: trypsin-like peptidase domain-containing protein, partial [Clostridia bacterium]|nr:trypsin-like peptidase domain-containing protein [Clostridia bacterium]